MSRSSVFCLSGLWIAMAAVAGICTADEPDSRDPSRLTVERIFGSDEFAARGYDARWLEDGSGYTRVEKAIGAPGQEIVRYRPSDGQRDVLVSAAELTPDLELPPLAIEDYAFSSDLARVLIFTNSRRVWRHHTRGDYWVLDRGSGELRQLGGHAPAASLMFAKFAPGGQQVLYVHRNNLFLEDLRGGDIQQLTRSDDPEILHGCFDWVYEEELQLRDGSQFSPDGKKLVYWIIDQRHVRAIPLVDPASGLYPEVTFIKYPKVGQRNPACRAAVLDLESKRVTPLEIPGDPTEHYLARLSWTPDSQAILVQQLNRRQDTLRLWLANAGTGHARLVLTEQDPAWVDVHDELFWLRDGAAFTWISERGQWRQAYVATLDGMSLHRLTSAPADVIQLLPVPASETDLYLVASPDNAAQRYLYRLELPAGWLHGEQPGPWQRITPEDQPGTHRYSISPDGRWAIHEHSTFEQPPRMELVSLPDHQVVRTLETNRPLRRRLQQLARPKTEFFRLDIGEGIQLEGWCILPPDLDREKKHPLIVHVYGEPAGQTVLDRWGGPSELWHWMLAQQGYIVASFDNRGTSAPRGRAWRKCVYQQIGILAPREQAAALDAFLAERPFVDPERVGIWGWSGGGSMSLNAIFKYPDRYRTAIAIAPVPNQRYYDTIYQERYMGLPEANVDGYRQGSPIHFAERLQGNLLLIHGTGDDNCHYQTTQLLINELIRLNKPFEMMAYPDRTHSIREGRNTTLHLRSLMTRFLHEHLPAN